MPTVAIRPDNTSATARFRARSGDQQATGRTMGEALDALVAAWGEGAGATAVLIERFGPDEFFSQEQYDRMQSLLARRATLDAEEQQELEELVFAEQDATVARTSSLAGQTQL